MLEDPVNVVIVDLLFLNVALGLYWLIEKAFYPFPNGLWREVPRVLDIRSVEESPPLYG